ncbi:hypothetical protein CRM22_003371 [Opisthorchis felineus]|uniref:Rapamycin-insensitive companion of mTOR domain-containing protein n=1 Tax=Opisthorchis felineus TaxID=147828 RepID=A0A4S2M241_OPIFE|nr:hypothetical protein CRM22_003371 [Opisthorchis felineus]
MPEVVTLANKTLFRNRASPKFSAALLNLDLQQKAVPLVLDLLTGICNDFTSILLRDKNTSTTCNPNQASEHSTPVPPVSSFLHLVVGRLNLLVLLSKRALLTLEPYSELRCAFIRAVFYVLRLTIWCHNRSVRCAALRCLRYYLHTCVDVRLFLDCRLDLLVARCLDLSYIQEPAVSSSQPTALSTCPSDRRAAVLYHNQPTTSPFPVTSTHVNPECHRQQPIALPTTPVGLPNWSTNQLVGRARRTINPRLRTTQAPPSLGQPEANFFASRAKPPASPSVSPLNERQLFLRLSYHLVRLAPSLFPASLIQALSAPCLRAGRFLSGGWTAGQKKKEEPIHLAHRFRQRGAVNGRALVEPDASEELQSITNDIALRSCLLIIAELIILAPEHIKTLSMGTHLHSKPSIDRPDSLNALLVQVLLTAFACSPDLNTVHPARVQGAVLLSLSRLMNSTRTLHLLPVRRVAKFLVPFTRILERPFRIKSPYDNYPSFTVCAKISLITILRSWSGLLYFLNEGLPCLQALMYSLAVGTTEMRDQILELLFGLFPTLPLPHPSVKYMEPAILALTEALANCAPFTLPMQAPVDDLCSVLHHHSISPTQSNLRQPCTVCPPTPHQPRRSPQTACDLEGGFVAAEGCRIFSKFEVPNYTSVDLMDSYNALLLATLVQAGLYEGIIRAISDSNESTSVRAGLLFGLLSYKAGALFPREHPVARRLHAVGLLQPRVEGSQLAVVWLERVHRVMHAHEIQLGNPASLIRIPLYSPFLECLARQSNAGRADKPSPGATDDMRSASIQASESWIDQIISQSGVVPVISVKPTSSSSSRSTPLVQPPEMLKDPDQWDWELLTSFGRYLYDMNSTVAWDDRLRLSFLHRLMDFITPGPDPSVGIPGALLDAHTCRSASIPITPFPRNLEELPPLRLVAKGHRDADSSVRSPKSISTMTNVFVAGQQRHDSPSVSTEPTMNFAWLPITWTHASAAAILAAGLVPHLALYPSASEPGRLLTRFLAVVGDALRLLCESGKHGLSSDVGAGESESNDVSHAVCKLFHPAQLRDRCSGFLILIIGRLTCSDEGESRLETSGLCSVFHSLLLSRRPQCLPSGLHMSSTRSIVADPESVFEEDRHTNLMKLLISSLDFTCPSHLGQHLLTAAVNGGSKLLRLYSLQLIRLLFRLRLPFLATWCLDLTVKLCLDVSRHISRRALYLLEELCMDAVNIQAVTRHVLSLTSDACQNSNSVTQITPFGYRLLSPNTGPVGHRIFGHVLSRHTSFNFLYPDPPNLVTTRMSSDLSMAAMLPNSVGGWPAGTDSFSQSVTSKGSPKTKNPVDWLLDVALTDFNLAYALEVDSRLSAAFIHHLIRFDPVKTSPSVHESLANEFTRFAPLQAVKCERNDDNHDPDSDSDDFYDRPSNLDYLFEGYFDSDTSFWSNPFSVIPNSTPPDSMQWLPLPKHIYASISEHSRGLDLLLRRGDLQAALKTLTLASGPLCNGTSTSHVQGSPKDDRPRIPSLLETKAALWALAHVGSTTCGQAWLAKQTELIGLFKHFSTSADSMGLRITAWLCLNLLISKAGGDKLLFLQSSGSNEQQLVWTTANTSGMEKSETFTATDKLVPVAFQNDPNGAPFSVFSSLDAVPVNSSSPNEPLCESFRTPITEKREVNESISVSGRHSSSLSRTPRWLPRKTPLRQKKASPPRNEPLISRSNMLSDSNPSPSLLPRDTSPVGDRFDADLRSTVANTNATCESKYQSANSSPLRYTTSTNYCSATWTHRDFLAHRRSISHLMLGDAKPSGDVVETATKTTWLQGFDRRLSKGVCFPMDLSVLGHKLPNPLKETSTGCHSSSFEAKRFHSDEDPANLPPSQCWLASAAERVRSLFPFVHVSTDVNTVLKRYAHSADDLSTSSVSSSLVLDFEGVSSSRFLSPQCQKLSSPGPLETPAISVGSVGPDPISKSSSLHSCNDRPPQKRPEPHSTNKCISRTCPGHSYGPERYLCDDATPFNSSTVNTNRWNWCRQLFEIVNTSLTNVTPIMSDQKLLQLIKSAARQQRESRTTGPDRSEAVFDACVFTDVALLLATYTFPLRARVKIHSSLLGLELYELRVPNTPTNDTIGHVIHSTI